MKKLPVITVSDVHKSYGRKPVLRGGEMTANPGEYLCVVGENGSGKSTFLKILAGMLRPDKGSITFRGKIGYCPQQSLLYHYLSVEEHFNLFGTAYGMDKGEIMEYGNELMEMYAYSDYRKYKIHQLSGGTQQKLNLSLSLLHDPDIILLDEPYVGFDYDTYENFLKYTDLALSRNKCIIMVSHLVYNKDSFDTIYNLRDGIIQEDRS